jgi:hypothetical protein
MPDSGWHNCPCLVSGHLPQICPQRLPKTADLPPHAAAGSVKPNNYIYLLFSACTHVPVESDENVSDRKGHPSHSGFSTQALFQVMAPTVLYSTAFVGCPRGPAVHARMAGAAAAHSRPRPQPGPPLALAVTRGGLGGAAAHGGATSRRATATSRRHHNVSRRIRMGRRRRRRR